MGRILQHSFHTVRQADIIGNIIVNLHNHTEERRQGEVFTSTVGFVIRELPSGRESFSPDASYYDGPLPANLMGFIEGAPTFAVEVRSENSYGAAAEAEMAAKRADYFAAGTLVVWDVDPIAETVTVYRNSAPDQPHTWHRGDTAEAEPAVPGWRISVDEIFA